MSNFTGTVLTNEGKKLLGKILAGEKLTFTRVCVGDGDVAEEDIKDLTDLASYKLTLPITTIQDMGDGTVKVRSTITNRGLTTGFFIRELGLYAKGEDGTEVLYAYTKSTDADFFPAETVQYLLEEIFEIITIIDQGEININIDGTVVFATIRDVEDRIAECRAECCRNKSSLETVTTLWSGTQPYFVGDYMNFTMNDVLAGVTGGILVIKNNLNNRALDYAIPVASLLSGYDMQLPYYSGGQYPLILIFNIKRQNDDLIFTSATYTGGASPADILEIQLIQ